MSGRKTSERPQNLWYRREADRRGRAIVTAMRIFRSWYRIREGSRQRLRSTRRVATRRAAIDRSRGTCHTQRDRLFCALQARQKQRWTNNVAFFISTSRR